MKKPEVMGTEQDSSPKNRLKEFWANKETRWVLIAAVVIFVITIVELVVHFAK